MKLKGRNAIITGASQGLGKAIAEHFVRAGAHVVLCARSKPDSAATQKELARLGRKQIVLAHVCDVSDETQVNDTVEFALRELGSVEVLVANAGVYGPMGPTESVDLKEWRQALDINLFGVLLPARALIPHFKKAGGGKIVAPFRRRRNEPAAQHQLLRCLEGGRRPLDGNAGGGIA